MGVNVAVIAHQILCDAFLVIDHCRNLHGGRLSHQWERTFATLALQMPFLVGLTIPLTTLQKVIQSNDYSFIGHNEVCHRTIIPWLYFFVVQCIWVTLDPSIKQQIMLRPPP